MPHLASPTTRVIPAQALATTGLPMSMYWKSLWGSDASVCTVLMGGSDADVAGGDVRRHHGEIHPSFEAHVLLEAELGGDRLEVAPVPTVPDEQQEGLRHLTDDGRHGHQRRLEAPVHTETSHIRDDEPITELGLGSHR